MQDVYRDVYRGMHDVYYVYYVSFLCIFMNISEKNS